MELNKKKIARAAILAATISGGVLMFVSPFDAQAYSGIKTKACYCTYYSNGDSKVSCEQTGSECSVVTDCRGCW